ncbi:hypothetical protein DERF_011143 [Dermatophagoides farinae]|uniref:Uncharacterized protein n=1 Tax=Dermatophagoides farinae TaxID=6954 RepID=A0A922L4I0_DERFA|nr:hypothetical protein DERF_011143 [Dermatophagoides farinae]
MNKSTWNVDSIHSEWNTICNIKYRTDLIRAIIKSLSAPQTVINGNVPGDSSVVKNSAKY